MGRLLKHVEIREYVRGLAQEAEPGAPTPSERDLVGRFGVARMTVRQALDALVSEGVLERFPGRGTFVAARDRVPTGVIGLTQVFEQRGLVVETRTLEIRRIAAGPALASTFGLEPGRPLWRWRRLRLAEGRPVCVSDTLLPAVLLPSLDTAPPSSLYAALARRGVRPSWAEDTMVARAATADEAVVLEIPAGEAVLCQHRRAAQGSVGVEATDTVYGPDTYPLQIALRG